MVFTTNIKKQKIIEFQNALRVTNDPYVLARLIQIPPPTKQSILNHNNNNQHSNHKNSPSVNNITDEFGNDWSHIVSHWLDALEASDAVRIILFRCCCRFVHHFLKFFSLLDIMFFLLLLFCFVFLLFS